MKYKFTQELKNFGEYYLSLCVLPTVFTNFEGEKITHPAGSLVCTREDKDGISYSFSITDNIHDSLAYWQMGAIMSTPDV